MNTRELSKYPTLMAEVKAATRLSVMEELKNFPSYLIRQFIIGPTLGNQFLDNVHTKGQGYDMSMMYKNPNEWVRMQASLHGMNTFNGRRVGGLALSNLTAHGNKPKVVMEFCGIRNKAGLNALRMVGQRELGQRVKYVCICGDVFNIDGTTNAKAELQIKSEIKRMKKAEAEGDRDRTLHILAIGMGSRSFSISEIEVVILGFDRGSENATEQKALRVLTDGKLWNGDIKTQGVVVLISMDYNRDKDSMSMLHKIILSDALIMKGENKDTTLREGALMTRNAFDVQLMDTEDKEGTFKKIELSELLTQDNIRTFYEEVSRGCFDISVDMEGEDDIVNEMAEVRKVKGAQKPRQTPKNKPDKVQKDKKESGDKSREENLRQTNRMVAYERIVYSVSNVYHSLLDITSDMPKTYTEALAAFPKNDTEIVEILGTSPSNVSKLVEAGALGLRVDFLNEIYLTFAK